MTTQGPLHSLSKNTNSIVHVMANQRVAILLVLEYRLFTIGVGYVTGTFISGRFKGTCVPFAENLISIQF